MSAFLDNIRIAISSLGSNKMRAVLTMLGITIGVMAVILLVSIGQAVETFIVGQFSSFGSNLVMVFGEESTTVTNEFEADDEDFLVPMTDADYRALRDPFRVPAASGVTAVLAPPVDRVEYGDRESKTAEIAGTTPEYFDVINRSVTVGRPFDQNDMDSAARVAILGVDTVEDLFDNQYPIGETIRMNGVSFRVIGVLNEFGTGLGENPDDAVVVPLTTAQQRLGSERTVDGDYPVMAVMLEAQGEDSVDALIRQVRAVLREEHDLDADEEDDFMILSQTSILDTLETITGLLTIFLGVIAGISLLVGGIGIMNIMLVTVTERTREIGLRKAVGAQNQDILTQFLVESVVLALVGGAIGTALAVTLSLVATALIPDLTVEVRVQSIALATIISIIIGAFFGAYPANRAAQLNPIDALRYE